jgi:hypothetical protein
VKLGRVTSNDRLAVSRSKFELRPENLNCSPESLHKSSLFREEQVWSRMLRPTHRTRFKLVELGVPVADASQLDRPQSQRIGDHRDGTEAHGSRGNHRVQEQSEGRKQHTRGKWHPDGVVDESEEQILADVAHG